MSDDTLADLPFPVDNHMVVMAQNPQQMQVSQQRLVQWFGAKLAAVKQELAETEENLALAKQRKWRTSGWQNQVRLARGRVTFYEKCIAALEAGYCIIPDFPTEIFAIRTSRKKPRKNKATRGWTPALEPQRTDNSPLGQGEYRSPHALEVETTAKIPAKNHRDEPITRTEVTRWADEFDIPDFPMKMVKPHVLDATGKAMARKIFDEMGALPARQRAGGDPIVTGRIVRREGRTEIALTFLVQWWIDTRDL